MNIYGERPEKSRINGGHSISSQRPPELGAGGLGYGHRGVSGAHHPKWAAHALSLGFREFRGSGFRVLYWDYIGIMAKKMQTTMFYGVWGFRVQICLRQKLWVPSLNVLVNFMAYGLGALTGTLLRPLCYAP